MGIDEVMAKWAGQFYDPEMSRALDERNMAVALGEADRLSRGVLASGAAMSPEDKQDAIRARQFVVEMTQADDESREMTTRLHAVDDDFKKKGDALD